MSVIEPASYALSVVIPLYNEADNVAPLFAALEKALLGISHEIVIVDDGSNDGTRALLEAHRAPHHQYIFFTRNFGQTSAMAAGIDAARGETIATMDGDLQNDPADIPHMLEKLHAEELDLLVGWRRNRKDGMVLRKIPSLIANRMIRRFSGVYVHDYGCTLKIFTARLAKRLELYGELHRFIPILAAMQGAKTAEMEVRHHPRLHGTSKYGLSRTFKVISDLLLMFFFLKYRQKPMHLFGTLGLLMLLAGGGIECYMLLLKILGESIGARPLFFTGILFLMAGIQLITAGFVSELVMRTYFEAQNKKPYVIGHHWIGAKVREEILHGATV